MWSYSFEIPILMILGIVLLFYFSRPRIINRRNRVFLAMVVAETLTVIFDVIACAFDNDFTSYHPHLVAAVNTFYFFAFFGRAFIMYLFASAVVKNIPEKKAIVRQLVRVPLYAGLIMSALSSIVGSAKYPYVIFYVDKEGYHAGKLYHFLYAIGFFYIVMALVILYVFWTKLKRRREKYGILLYNLLIFAGLLMRLLLPKYLVMDTFVLMAILVVFLAFMNPEFFVDLRGVAFNRLAFSEQLEEDMGRFRNVPLGVVIHNFYEMRDIYGSAHLEEGLTLIGRFIKQQFQKSILFYVRNGRFIVLCQPGTDVNEKTKIIAERFAHPWKTKEIELYLRVGFATFEVVQTGFSHEIILTTMLKTMDLVGRTASGEPIAATEINLRQVEKEKMIRQSIETAIEGVGFELFLQPIVDAGTGKVIGAEALSRVRDAEGKIIMPGEFIPVAENSGRINELGELVFDRTCKFIKEHPLKKLGIDWINVNLSPAQFIRTDLAELYSKIVNKYGIDPECVHLEITEGAMIDDNFLRKQINAMTGKGFKFVLDDYGTGYSNLERLKKCPFINIKLDMSIVWGFCREPDAILPTMIRAFKHMGFSITAEGVEDKNMQAAMEEIGCDFLQGYLYSKPVPAEEFAKKYAAF